MAGSSSCGGLGLRGNRETEGRGGGRTAVGSLGGREQAGENLGRDATGDVETTGAQSRQSEPLALVRSLVTGHAAARQSSPRQVLQAAHRQL